MVVLRSFDKRACGSAGGGQALREKRKKRTAKFGDFNKLEET
jgi:hypothetical protein